MKTIVDSSTPVFCAVTRKSVLGSYGSAWPERRVALADPTRLTTKKNRVFLAYLSVRQ